ncbi:hypothetical protein ACYSNO_01000 [Enterococcus sp. LJL98]
MKAVRRFGFLIGVLLIGIIIGNFGSLIAFLILGPLFTLWLILWDDKRLRQRRYQQECYQMETEYFYSDDFH